MSPKPDLTHLTHLPYVAQLGKLETNVQFAQDLSQRADASNASKIAGAAIGGSAVREALTPAPHLFAALPLASTLTYRTHSGARFVTTTSRIAYQALRNAPVATRVAVFSGSELSAMAVAAENGRGSPAVLDGWLAAKLADGAQRLDEATALGGVQAGQAPDERWPLSRVLRAYGAELVAVGCGDEVPR